MRLSQRLTGKLSSVISGGSNIKLLSLQLLPDNVVIDGNGNPVVSASGQYVVTNNVIPTLLKLSNDTPVVDVNGSYIILSEV